MIRTLEDYSGWRLPFYWAGKRLSYMALKTQFRVSISGKEHVPPNGSGATYMVASNHLSNWDPVLVGNLITEKNVAYIAKRELVEVNPLVTFILDGLGIIAIDRNNVSVGSIKSAKTIANHPKWQLGIFPEGTRKKPAVNQPSDSSASSDAEGSKRGAAFLSKATKSALLPVGIRYDHTTTPKRVHAHIGEIIPISSDIDSQSERLMTAIRECEAVCEKALAHYRSHPTT